MTTENSIEVNEAEVLKIQVANLLNQVNRLTAENSRLHALAQHFAQRIHAAAPVQAADAQTDAPHQKQPAAGGFFV